MPLGLEGLVWDAEELRERLADRRDLDLGTPRSAPARCRAPFLRCLARCELELARREHRIRDQEIVFRLDELRLLALAQRDRERLRELG
jgi:hypothetical protein